MFNTFVLVTVCIGIAILLTEVVKREEVIVRVTTVIGIIAMLTGSPFVNLENFGATLQMIARFTPSFWNAEGNRILFRSYLGVDVNMSDFWIGIGIQLAFAAAIFAVALVIGREKKQAEA